MTSEYRMLDVVLHAHAQCCQSCHLIQIHKQNRNFHIIELFENQSFFSNSDQENKIFLKEYPAVLKEYPYATKVSKIRTKIINKRRRTRAVYQKNMGSMLA
jgi:hypothetical protein